MPAGGRGGWGAGVGGSGSGRGTGVGGGGVGPPGTCGGGGIVGPGEPGGPGRSTAVAVVAVITARPSSVVAGRRRATHDGCHPGGSPGPGHARRCRCSCAVTDV